MKLLGFYRFKFVGAMYLNKENPQDPNGTPVLTYEKDVYFDFTDDPDAPRQVIVAAEPFPQSTVISNIRDRYDVQPLPGAEYTITAVVPVISSLGTREVYRHQAALRESLDFGYDGIVRTQ